MRFVISRASNFLNDEVQPVPQAVKGRYVSVDIRTVDSPDKLQYEGALKEWHERGSNHRVVDGQIRRDLKRSGWLLDFADLQELMDFIHDVGSVVITPRSDPADTPRLKIYDDYLE
jgi:hypothetical protein